MSEVVRRGRYEVEEGGVVSCVVVRGGVGLGRWKSPDALRVILRSVPARFASWAEELTGVEVDGAER